MCRAVTCATCGKTTWAGCGRHVDQVLAGVAPGDRCPGHPRVSTRRPMNIDRAVLALAGTLTLASVLLGTLASPWWLLLAAFVGANLLQASVTGFCPAAVVLRRLGLRSGSAFP